MTEFDPDYIVRQAAPEDAHAWAAMRAALWPDHEPAEHAREAARILAQVRTGPGTMPELVLVAEGNGPAGRELIGFAEVSRRLYAEGCATSPVGFLEGWFVAADRRRRGVGRALVAAAEAWASAAGCREFASDALADNAASALAHNALGFAEVEVIRCFRKELAGSPVAGAGGGPNRSMPPGVVIPELAYPDVRLATEWLCRAFGFTERLRIGEHRAQLSVGEGSVVVTSRGPSSGDGDATHAVMVRVTDIDHHCERARAAGARIAAAPADYPYGERQYSAVDLGGHRWKFSATIADVDPASWGGFLPPEPR